jgi:hypothetical protein
MAMPLTPMLTEEVVNLLSTQLKNNFNTYLTEVDNQYDDGISLEGLDDEAIFISNKYEPLTMPCAFILFDEHALQYSGNPNYMESDDKCVIVISSEDIGADVLTRKMYRYAKVLYACFNLVALGDSSGRLQIKCIPMRIGYTDPISSKLGERERRFRMDCVMELSIQHFEKNLT